METALLMTCLRCGYVNLLRVQILVGARGFEPPTSRSRTVRAAKLRYAPYFKLGGI